MSDWDEIKRMVEDNGNVCTVTMQVLRDAAGKDKLGVNVCANISKTLVGMGLGHVPAELPFYQYEQVRLYKHGTTVGDLINTVLGTGEQNDKKLKGLINEEEKNCFDIIEQIRVLVAE
jgi:hypothetical protein